MGAARNLAFYSGELVRLLFRARLPGDTMTVLGTLVFAYDMVVTRFTLRSVSEPGGGPHAGRFPTEWWRKTTTAPSVSMFDDGIDSESRIPTVPTTNAGPVASGNGDVTVLCKRRRPGG